MALSLSIIDNKLEGNNNNNKGLNIKSLFKYSVSTKKNEIILFHNNLIHNIITENRINFFL